MPEELQVNDIPKEIEQKDIWQPDEEKEWPPYIESRFKLLNVIQNLDMPAMQEWFSKTKEVRIIPDALFFLLQRANDEKLDDKSLEEVYQVIESTSVVGKNTEYSSRSIEALVQMLSTFGEKFYPILYKWAADNPHQYSQLRSYSIMYLGKLGGKGFDLVEKILDDPSEDKRIQHVAAGVLGDFGEMAEGIAVKLLRAFTSIS